MEAELNQCQVEELAGKGITPTDVEQSLDQNLVVSEEATETETNKQEGEDAINPEGGEVEISGDHKTDNEENQRSPSTKIQITEEMSAQNTEKREEGTTCTQPAGANVDGDRTKGTADSGRKDCAAQADSTRKTDTTRSSGKDGIREKERSANPPRSTTKPSSQGRPTKKDIAEKFGGVATSGIRVQRPTNCAGNAVKNMLLEWCRAKTRGREGVDIQNFSSSWSSGLAFCALIVAYFPDAFDYDSLDPKNRRQNFEFAFNAAEKLADCPPLLDIDDMVHMKVPDSKCVYTYVQELYRSLVAKGLVKTKKA